MKKFLVVLLACAMIFGFASTALAEDVKVVEFNDLAEQSQAVQNAVMKMAVLGVVEGNDGLGGAFRPAENVTRAEFAKIVCYLTGNVKSAEALATVGSRFSDVSTGNWYTGWVNMAAQSGYFFGDPDGRFRPNSNITMQEVVTVALRAAGYNDKLGSSTGNSVWPGNYNVKAQNIGLLDDVTFVGSAPATRADMAVICEAVLGINMVVHINNDIAYALALSDGTVDPDGYSEVYYISNETNRNKVYETILHKAFKGVYYDVQVAQARPTATATRTAATETTEAKTVITPNLVFDETTGWSYEDYASGELALNVKDSYVYAGDKKFESVKTYTNSSKEEDLTYNGPEALASKYYITRGFDLSELAAMQVQLTVIDGKEIAFVDVVSSYQLAKSIHQDRSANSSTAAQNVAVDGTNFRASNTMGVKGVKDIDDYGNGYEGGYNTTTDKPTLLLNLSTSDNDNTFPGKVYLDKDGRIYGVKNYNTYDKTAYGIFDKVESNRVEWKLNYGSSSDMKLETNKKYTLYKDGESIKADDLEENDLISYLGDNGAPFYVVSSSLEGELSDHNTGNNRLKIDGTFIRVIDQENFAYSDDGGETFTGVDLNKISVDYGESAYAMAYNFHKLGYVTANITNTKIIGVITKIEPTQVWSGGERKDRYEKITIFNAEGKEITYDFTSDFRDGYTTHVMDGKYFPSITWSPGTNGSAKWTTAIADSKNKNIGALAKGDIIQLVLDKSDKVKRIANYAAFKPETPAKDIKVNTSNSRITLPSGVVTLDANAVVFNVKTDGGDYDDVAIQTVSSVLAKDFTAAQIVAFDTKSDGKVTALYIIGDVSSYRFGIITAQGRDNTGTYFTINNKRVYSSDVINKKDNIPGIMSYTESGGEATATGIGAYGFTLANGDEYYHNIKDIVASLKDSNTFAVAGKVASYSSSTKQLIVGTTNVYITEATYLYDLVADDDIDVTDLKGETVVAFYDKNNEADFVAVVGTGNKAGAFTADTKTVAYIDLGLAAYAAGTNTVTSSNTGVATAAYDATGANVAITSVATGTAVITVKDSATNTATISVSVGLNGTLTYEVHPYFTAGTATFTASQLNFSSPVATASTSDAKVATVVISNATGDVVITATGVGTATITVRDTSGATSTVSVEVTATGTMTTTVQAAGISPISFAMLGAFTDSDGDVISGEAATTLDAPEIAATYRYTSAGVWSGLNSGNFEFGTPAVYTITLTANTGFSFNGTDITKAMVAAEFTNGSPAVTVTNNGATLVIALSYTVQPIVVDAVGALTQMTGAPAAAGTASALSAAVATGTGYTAAAGSWTSGLDTTDNTKFAASGNAVYTIVLTAATGYTFTGTTLAAADFNGLAATGGTVAISGTPGATLTITITYTIQ